MAEELIPNDTPEIAKLKACKTVTELVVTYELIEESNGYKYFSENYKTELSLLLDKRYSDLLQNYLYNGL